MKRPATFHALCVAAFLMAATTPAPADTPSSDPAAAAVADRVMEALGGRERWEALPGLRWSFGSEVNDTVRSTRRHAWDKHGGWHRVEGVNRRGQRYCIVHHLQQEGGRAWVDGTAIEGDSLAALVRTARSLWINDSYWFLMPYKLRDPGVSLQLEGETREGDVVFDRVAMSFDQVGETPGDRYWVLVNRANARIEKWEYLLQGREPPPVVSTWEGWEQHGGLWFPTAHRIGTRNTFTRDVELVTVFPPGTFTAP